MSTSVYPDVLTVQTTETFPFTLEWADLLNGVTITAPNGLLIDNGNHVYIPNGIAYEVGINGTQTQYVINGSTLRSGHVYTAICTVGVSNSNNILAQTVTVKVPR